MEVDYPAAHSMDTTWFAVDQDGYLGVFTSGEAGAVPYSAFRDSELEKRFREALAENGQDDDDEYQKFTLANLVPDAPPPDQCLLDPSPGRLRRHMWVGGERDKDFVYSVYMFVASPEVAEEIADEDAQVLPASEGGLVYWSLMLREHYDQLHADRICWHCRSTGKGWSRSGDLSGWAYLYDNFVDGWPAGPYAREAQPLRPLRVTDLPPDLQEDVKAVQFPFRFAERPHLQPLEYMHCGLWGDERWIDSNGLTHYRADPNSEGWDDGAGYLPITASLNPNLPPVEAPVEQDAPVEAAEPEPEPATQNPAPEEEHLLQEEPRKPWWRFW